MGYSPKWTGISVLIRDQVSYSTWLLIGALIQSALVHFLRPPHAYMPAVLLTLYVAGRYTLESVGLLSNSTGPEIQIGRYTAHPPSGARSPPSESDSKAKSPAPVSSADADGPGVVMFLLGFHSSHPLRIMAPGTKTIGDHFNGMFDAAEADPTSGLLGKCGPLMDASGEGGNAMYTISYWSSVEKLKGFHSGPEHSAGMKWYYAHRARYPYLGLMHEIYDCPPGHFENVYINFRQFGFRTTKWLVDGKQVPAEVRGGGKGVREKEYVK